MDKVSTKKVVMNGLMIALVFLVTRFTSIPTPVGYFNIGDVAIMVTAVLLGRNSGFVAGAVGSAIADISSGYAIFAPVTFIVKGLEGYVVGLIANSSGERKTSEFVRIIAMITGSVIMIAGYFLAETYILGMFDATFGFAAAVKDLVTTNLAQGGISAVVGYALTTVLVRSNVKRYILN